MTVDKAPVAPADTQDENQRLEDERAVALIEARRASPSVGFDAVLRETLDRD